MGSVNVYFACLFYVHVGCVGLQYITLIMDARSASVHVIFCQCFFHIFFIPALVGQTAERIFTKLSHVVDIRHHLRTY